MVFYTKNISYRLFIKFMNILIRSSWQFKFVVALTTACLGMALYVLMPSALRAQTAPTLPGEAALGAPCPLLNSGDSILTGFGAPYNLFSSSRELLFKPFCTSKGFIARFGYDSAGTVAIYRTGYRWDGTRWSSMSYSADGGITSGYYIIGKAKTSSQRYATTTNTTFIAFTCTYTNNAWKCGCRDSACSTPYWQLQGATNVFKPEVSVNVSTTSLARGQGFNVTYRNNGDQPIYNCPGKTSLEYLSGSQWRSFSLRPVGVTSSSCLSSLLAAGSSYTVSFSLPTNAPVGTWHAIYEPDSTYTFYSSNFNVTSDSCTHNCEPPPPGQCSDGIDNDGDGKVDYPADTGCSSRSDTTE